MKQTEQIKGSEDEKIQSEFPSGNSKPFATRVIVSIALGRVLRNVRTCDLQKVIEHVVPLRQLRFCQIEKYAMQVLSHHLQEQLPFLKDLKIKDGESDDQFVSYYEGLYGETLSIKGGSGAFL